MHLKRNVLSLLGYLKMLFHLYKLCIVKEQNYYERLSVKEVEGISIIIFRFSLVHHFEAEALFNNI
jgi:hypothetical protein